MIIPKGQTQKSFLQSNSNICRHLEVQNVFGDVHVDMWTYQNYVMCYVMFHDD